MFIFDNSFKPKKSCRPPLFCWDRYAQTLLDLPERINKRLDMLALQEFQLRYNWISTPHDILQTSYQAIVLTDVTQKIIWVNRGFQEMTGYPTTYAIGKKPSFLQGEKTDVAFRSNVKKSVSGGKYYFGHVINYRKNQDEYHCEVSIFPLYNKENALTHFIALEREV